MSKKRANPSSRSGRRRYVAAGLAAGLTAGAGAGFLLEQGGVAGAAGVAVATPTTDPVDGTATTDTTATTDPSASDASTDPTDTDRRVARLTEILQPLIDAGTITQEQADAVIAAIDAAGPIGGGPGDRGGRIGAGLDVVATALGMTVDDLRTALQDGSTIRELATAAGVDPQTVVDAIVAEATTRLDERVAAGDMTQDEADAKLATITERATALLDATGPLGGDMHGGPGMHGRGDHGDRDDDAANDTGTSGSGTDDSTSVTAAG